MANHHFKCTACGKCCYGWLPLTLADALANAAAFPLAMAWSPVGQRSRAFESYAKMGITVQLPDRKKAAVLIAPTSYIPPVLACPALSADNLCSIQNEKPLRCRTMPFYPYFKEEDQLGSLVPRKDWLCDVSDSAPIVYENKRIIDRTDFDREQTAHIKDAPKLRAYAEKMLKQNASLMKLLADAMTKPAGGRFVVSFHSFLRLNKVYDLKFFAKRQHPVLLAFANKTKTDTALIDYHHYYAAAAQELAWLTDAKEQELQP